jgi:hypothetical protein
VIVMVGLPARGKSFIAQKLRRWVAVAAVAVGGVWLCGSVAVDSVTVAVAVAVADGVSIELGMG